jgi:hypothetical protein
VARHNAYRDGYVHVCRTMCATCVFRPGNLMHLRRGRVRGMVDEAKANEAAIICHKTLAGDNAVCRGFFDRHPTPPLHLAERLGVLKLQDEAES